MAVSLGQLKRFPMTVSDQKEANHSATPFDAGMAAYQRGDYATAMQHWRPLADKGNAVAQLYLGILYEEEGPLRTLLRWALRYRRGPFGLFRRSALSCRA